MLDKKFYRGRGCAACNNTGFKGRTGLYELMLINDRLRELINHGALDRAAPRRWPCRPACGRCATAGMEKVYSGVTTLEEVIRETVHE